jgi:hypothetical protein
MMRNYQKELEQKMEALQKEQKVPVLLLHSCCAPCSSYCLEYLSRYFRILLFYYNPNISPREEYEKRAAEQKRLVEAMETTYPVTFLEGPYEPERYAALVKGLEEEPEGGSRCRICFAMRLAKAAQAAKEQGAEYFTTTLSISPQKSASLLNTIGEQEAEKAGVSYLPSDFKKKDGYRRSVELSKEYGLYRQDFCGCIHSKRERMRQKQEKESFNTIDAKEGKEEIYGTAMGRTFHQENGPVSL